MKTKDFRLYKRADDGKELPPTAVGYRDRNYYFKFTHRGVPYARCLETNNADDAQAAARKKYLEIVEAVRTQNPTHLAATKLRSEQSATLEELFAAYRIGPSQAGADTRQTNINALRQIIQVGRDTPCAPDKIAIKDLSPELARQWFKTIQQTILTTKDQEAAASLKRSANSRWIQAASLFTEICLADYQDLGLIPSGITGLAGLEAFLKAGRLAMFTRIPKKNYNPPPEKVITQTLRDWEELTDRDMFLAIGHELAFGLRVGEMIQARWDWHSQRAGYPVLDGRAQVKGGTGLIQIRALDPYYSTMKRIATAQGWWPADTTSNNELVIQGKDNYRTDELYRQVGEWLRARGWETLKTNHALRAYAGSQVAMKYGIYEAQIFLRHSSVKVTEESYSHFITKFKPADLNTLPARWAILPATQATNAQPGTATPVPADDTLDASRDFQQPPSPSITGFALPHSRN